MSALNCPILVISSTSATRKALELSLKGHGGAHAFCSTFKAAEQLALAGEYSGILVDLTTMIKAKDEEKIIACSLVNVYPTLRVRAQGTMLVPMATPGGEDAQDSSLNEFLRETCAAFVSRRLRAHKRYEICTPTMSLVGDLATRGVTQNLSWGGAFIVDMHPERLAVGDELTVTLTDFALPVRVVIDWIQPWGERRLPGYGVHFCKMDDALRVVLDRLLPIGSEQARDRLVG